MTPKEFRDLISKDSSIDWYENLIFNINYSQVNFNQEFKGITSFYTFVYKQNEGWNKIENDLPPELIQSMHFFSDLLVKLVDFFHQTSNQSEGQRRIYWQRNQRIFEKNSPPIFLYSSVEVAFLIEIFETKEEYYEGAYQMIIGNIGQLQNDKNNFIGGMLAYEFYTKEISVLTSRKKKEQVELSHLKNDFQKYLSNSSEHLTNHLNEANNEYKNYVDKLEELKENKSNAFETWFSNVQTLFSDFNSKSAKTIEEKEKLYSDKLMLQAPAQYWEERSSVMRTQGYWWMTGILVFTIIGIICLYNLLNSIGTGDFEKTFNNTGSSIKWSILFITFISFFAFLIRTFTKLTFSSFHLSRDAQERKQLTYVYLSLKEEGAISESERHIILQSLFSRADTGLLKEDSSPTMPTNSIIEKVTKSSS